MKIICCKLKEYEKKGKKQQQIKRGSAKKKARSLKRQNTSGKTGHKRRDRTKQDMATDKTKKGNCQKKSVAQNNHAKKKFLKI